MRTFRVEGAGTFLPCPTHSGNAGGGRQVEKDPIVLSLLDRTPTEVAHLPVLFDFLLLPAHPPKKSPVREVALLFSLPQIGNLGPEK